MSSIANRGFSLIELVVVIVLMSILSLAGVEIIGYTADAYASMLGRQTLGNSARIAVDKMSREIRQGLPASARVVSSCVEYIPIAAAGSYLDLPVEASAISFQAVPMNNGQGAVTGRVAVYPISNSLYDLSNNVLSGAATLSTPDTDNQITVTLASSFQFANHSPGQRFFIVQDPVSFCIDGDNLFRYQNYGLSNSQPDIIDLPTSLPDRALLVNKVGTSGNPFEVLDASLQRNALVAIDLTFLEDGETVRILHEVQLRNVP
ncbi:MAG: prepilin-type N-terminal cleavage/methylation domain-containing protein [Pseudomonadales bacterium]|nr:prepilin-type N-terminal cleavage/methylation domain-containing protein [Pseudomonadales bacterium]